jgi:hypothetical protein
VSGLDFSRLANRFGPEGTARVDPVEWASTVLTINLWSAQREIMQALLDHTHVAVKSAHGTGKSLLAAVAMLWWISGAGRPVGEALAVSSAPTSTQLSAVVWRELARLHRLGALPGRVTGGAVPTWTIDGAIVALGRKPQDLVDVEAATSAFQGLHARWPLVVLDEAGGCPAFLYDGAEAVATSEASRILAIGNPTDPHSRFATVCAPGSGWHVITVPAESTPAFTGEKVSPALLEMLVSPRWVAERRQRWGESSPLWTSRVMAEFPTNADDALVELAHIEAAQRRELPGEAPPIYGVDAARGGKDFSVVYENRGGRLRMRHRENGADLMSLTGTVARLLHDGGVEASAVIDATGIGAGVFDRLREQGLPVRAFVAAERASDPSRYKNRRAETAWRVRELAREGALDIHPGDEALAGELVAQTWGVDSSGRIILSPKSDQAKSPDHFDAAAMSLAGSGVGQAPVIVTGRFDSAFEQIERGSEMGPFGDLGKELRRRVW